MAGKYRVTTLGCKVNQYESEQVRELLESLGYRPAAGGEPADVAVVNTCVVTRTAAAKSRQALRRLARNSAETIAIGCGASADAASLAGLEGVTRAIGHQSDILAEIHRWATGSSGRDRPPAIETSLPTTTYSMSGHHMVVNSEPALTSTISRFTGRTRAFLKVQDGCDAGCSYCIVSKLRTRLMSKPIELAVEEARGLVSAGHREIVVTGVYLGAFGRQTAIRRRFAAEPSALAELVDALARVEGLARLRLSSLEPGDVDERLLEVMDRHDNCVPHFHLPLQSGSPDVLRRMNRQYTVDQYAEMIDRLRSRFDRPAITTDIIVGFPGESEDDFERTLAVARDSRFCKIHAFRFSSRPGTAAARWTKQFVHDQTVKERMVRLRRLERELAAEYRARFVGQSVDVLVETAADGTGSARGRASRYFEVWFPAGTCQPGDLVTVRIDRADCERVDGVMI